MTVSDLFYRPGGIPKPEPRVRTKRRATRVESKQKQSVRQQCVERDGDCVFEAVGLGPCEGESEWCHVNEGQRWKTRGMAPEDRHTTALSLMGCTKHHDMLDGRRSPRLFLQLGPKGCDDVFIAHCGSVRVRVERQRKEPA